MKIVQSMWTKPFFNGEATVHEGRLNGGWPHRRFNYYSIAFSAMQLKKYFGSVELVTDDLGKEIFVDKLGIPYTTVKLSLNDLHAYDPALWALGKIRTFSEQSDPFLHVDADVFLWKKIDDRVLKGKLIAQNKETKTAMFSNTFNYVLDNFEFVPDYIRKYKGVEAVPFTNAGIIGGTDVDFFKYYTREVSDFVEKNRKSLEICISQKGFDTTYLNVLFEQIFFYSLSQERSVGISYLFPQANDNPLYVGFLTNELINDGYTHCFGNHKKLGVIYYSLEQRFKKMYPREYDRVNQMLLKCEV